MADAKTSPTRLNLILRISKFKIDDEAGMKELKSLIRDIAAAERSDACNGLHSQSCACVLFISSVQSQLTAVESEDVANTLAFMKTVSEMQIAQPSSIDRLTSSKIEAIDFDLSPDTPVVEDLCLKNDPDYLYDILLQPLFSTFIDYFLSVLKQACESEDMRGSATTLHQVLGIVHKTVRTSLSLLKRLESGTRLSDKNAVKVQPVLEKTLELMRVFCDLLENQFLECELDIKCSIGLAICLALKILCPDSRIHLFYKIFSMPSATDNNDKPVELSSIERRILEVSQCTVNRISIAFGVLNLIGNSPDSLDLLKPIAENVLNVEHGTKEAVSLGSARILELWMSKLSELDPAILSEYTYLFPEIEFFLFNNLAAHIDAVKGCCRNIVSLVARVYDLIDGPKSSALVKGFLQRFLYKPPHVKWAGIAWTARSTSKSLTLLEIIKSVPEVLLSTERIFKNAATDTYLSLMGYHFDVVPVDQWLTTWIDPLFLSHKVQSNESNWSQKRSIVCAILKSNKKNMNAAVMQYILKKVNTEYMRPEASQLAVEAVKLASELGVKMDIANIGSNDGNFFQGIIPRHTLNSWLWSGNPQARIAAFSLIVDTKKTTDPISASDFESIKLFLLYNLVSQNPAFRQQYFSLFKKLLRRLRDSYLLVKKKRDTERPQHYDNFFKWMWVSFTDQEGLFPGANFARRCQALECLAEFTAQFDLDLYFNSSDSNNLSYLRWLNDSYENNKIVGLKILEKIPMPILEDYGCAEAFLSLALDLCISVKPPESVTGRYLVVCLMKKCHMSPLALLNRLYNRLNVIVARIETTSFIEISSQIAIYGYISCIRMILKETDEYLTKTEDYRKLSENLISICFKFDDIFFPLLGSAAPEGTLIDKPEENDKCPKVVRSIGAQKMLVCSWRSMRDACHLMNEMCSLFPLEGEKSDYILSLEQVENIGTHQLFLLKNLMHRGVFEQIFVGFKLLTTRLYKSSAVALTKLIDKWLETALDEDLMSSKSTTRRSAGLPFILQALLAPGAGNETFIRKYVNGLFSKESDSPQIRIHIMNVLRALFRDANFSRAMMPYVPNGLRVAFKAQASNYWPEQNSGLMLLGAVVRRTFGPLLNSMSASTFFRKFPEMYEFLLGEVRNCSEKLHEKNSAGQFLDFTFYVLVLLSSFATKGVVEDAHFPLHRFIPYIRACGNSSDVRVRKVAAKALIPFLLDPTNQSETINTILNELRDLELNTCQIHGNLCALLAILRTLPTERRTAEVVQHLVASLTESQSNPLQRRNPLIYEAMATLCTELGAEATNLLKIVLQAFEIDFGSLQDRHAIPDLPNTDRKLYEVKILFELTDKKCVDPGKIVYDYIFSENLVFIEQLLSVLCSNKMSIFEEASSSVILNVLVTKYVTTDFIYKGQQKVEELFLELFCKIPDLVYTDWLRYVVESENVLSNFFEKVLNICEMQSGIMACKAKAVELLGKLACEVQATLSNDHKERFCNVTSSLCDSQSYDEIRFGVAKCLPNLTEDNNFKLFTVRQQCKLWFTFLMLAQDDEFFVREEINSKWGSECGTFCDIKLIENLIQLFFNNFVINHMKEGLALLLGFILRDDYIVAEEADDSEEERLFDKSETNSFSEPFQVAKIVRAFLSQNVKLLEECRNVFCNVKLNQEDIEMYEFTSNSTVASGSVTFTLLDLCKDSILPKPKSSTLLSCFIESEKSSIQNSVKEFIRLTFTS